MVGMVLSRRDSFVVDDDGCEWVPAYLAGAPEAIRAVEHNAELGMPVGTSARLRGMRRAAKVSGGEVSKMGRMTRQQLWSACCAEARRRVRPFLGGTHLPPVPKKHGWDVIRFNPLPGHPGVVGGLKAIVLHAGAAALGIDVRDAVGWRVEEATLAGIHRLPADRTPLSSRGSTRGGARPRAEEGRRGPASRGASRESRAPSTADSSRSAMNRRAGARAGTRAREPLVAELLRGHPLMRDNAVRDRMQLIGDDNMVAFTLQLWLLCLLDSAPEQLDVDIGRQALGAVGYRRLAAALRALLAGLGRAGHRGLAPGESTPSEFAEEDWECDVSTLGRPSAVQGTTRGGATGSREDWVIEFPGFSRIIFDLIDVWVPNHSLEAYSTFFAAVLKGISSPSGDGLLEWTLVAPLHTAGVKGRVSPWFKPLDGLATKGGSTTTRVDRLRFPSMGNDWGGLAGSGSRGMNPAVNAGRVALFTPSIVDPLLGGRGSIYPGQGVEGHPFSTMADTHNRHHEFASMGEALSDRSYLGTLEGESSVLNSIWLDAEHPEYSIIFGNKVSSRRRKKRTPKACARDLNEVLARARLPDLV